jgi:flagellin
MSLVVNTNVSSLYIQKNLSDATSSLTLHLQRLSSGVRVNDSSDDAAGLGLSQKLKTQIDGSDVASKNTQTGINMLQVADADMGVIADKLQRMRELAVQSANGVYSSSERKSLDTEFVSLKSEIDRIAQSSSFSDLKLLNTSGLNVTLQVGTNNTAASDRITITFNKTDAATLGLGSNYVSTQTLAQTSIGNLDTAIQTISNQRSVTGATINRLQGTISRTEERQSELSSAYSSIMDTDIAAESAAYTKSQILQKTSAALLQQANQAPALALNLIQ